MNERGENSWRRVVSSEQNGRVVGFIDFVFSEILDERHHHSSSVVQMQ